jgi:LysM repeat protein
MHGRWHDNNSTWPAICEIRALMACTPQSRRAKAALLAAALVLLLGAWPAGARAQPGLSASEPKNSDGAAQAGVATKAAPKLEAPARKEAPRRARKKKPRRGGINPCMTPDPGWGVYDRWSRRISIGQMIAPQQGGLTRNGGFDLIVHFHGHYPIRKEFVKTARGIVLVAIDLGTGSGAYQSTFSSPAVFTTLLKSVEREMARRSGRKRTHVRKLGLSSWSAGYGAVSRILAQKAGKKVDALILLDSVYAGYKNKHAKDLSKRLTTAQIKPFLKFARRAAGGSRFMFQSYSSIPPPGYASTGEVADYMVRQIGGRLRKSRRSDRLGLELFQRYDRRNYHVRGYRGNDKPDHCAHLGLMRDVLKVHINPRWRTPRGRRGKKSVSKAKVAARKSGNVHVVSSGEHLGGIAKRYGTSVSALRDANGLTRGKPIRIGQELLIPGGGGRAAKRTKKSGPKAGRGERVHVVADGHSLGKIAQRYHVSVKAIRERNDLRKGGRPIQPGQKLIIPRKN